MASEVSICNKAILQVGGNSITSLGDGTTEANLCNEFYADLRDEVLEAHDWSFALARKSIAADPAAPVFLYANRFLVPSDVLRIIDVNRVDINDEKREWQVEEGYIVMNDETCKVHYVKQVTDTLLFSPLFVSALAARIAADLAVPLTQSIQLEQTKMQKAEFLIKRAAAVDNLQGKKRRLRSRWLSKARLTSGPASAGPYV